jgi:hypothetical protein
VNAEDLAADRWKPIKQAREQIAKSEAALAASRTRLEELRSVIPATEARDREALGAALVDGKNEPTPEAEQLRTELAAEERRNDALQAAVERARGEIGRRVQQNKSGWYRLTLGDLTKAEGRYLAAIDELGAARDGLSDAASLLRWISAGGAATAEAANDSLAGRVGTDIANPGPPVSFSATIAELRRDAQRLSDSPAELEDPRPMRVAWERITRAAS